MSSAASSPSFATPLPQSPRSPVLEWRFPKPYSQYVLTGRSRAAWHTSFVVPQLNLLLDAGLCVNKLRPKHVFLTHGHSDHTLLAPAFVKRDDPPDVFCPREMAPAFDDFVLANTMLNLGGLVRVADAAREGLLRTGDGDGDDGDCGDGEGEDERDGDGSGRRERSADERAWLGTHVTHGVSPGDEVPLRRAKGITARVFACDHTVPCVGYVFSQTTHRLRPELASLSGPELKRLREEAAAAAAASSSPSAEHDPSSSPSSPSPSSITEPHTAPIFAFLGDTTAATLAAAPDWLRAGIPVVVTECSFLRDEHAAQAERTKHTLWRDLEPVVRRWPRTTFVLMHFSLRYSDAEVARFFRDMDDVPPNIVVWADPEAE
ncbi:Ribonuclease Z [Purpureocillium takamizusanense]|uniref:Ribonuclease Z n=1 Tax=Purpureocillium takamizusanense TaxID=2060973 RepID=A0A9Q8V8Q1_9HYPO|nr:Ribonuclease Z [Purpureocillium takamizusanense]UNI16022.1 Ribonuclease Z [Purpureocillium takamizusanense]